MKRKLVYWVALREDDAICYSLRFKTRKELLAEIKRMGLKRCKLDGERFLTDSDGYLAARYSLPRKVTVAYTSPFDLLSQCLSESGICED